MGSDITERTGQTVNLVFGFRTAWIGMNQAIYRINTSGDLYRARNGTILVAKMDLAGLRSMVLDCTNNVRSIKKI